MMTFVVHRKISGEQHQFSGNAGQGSKFGGLGFDGGRTQPEPEIPPGIRGFGRKHKQLNRCAAGPDISLKLIGFEEGGFHGGERGVKYNITLQIKHLEPITLGLF